MNGSRAWWAIALLGPGLSAAGWRTHWPTAADGVAAFVQALAQGEWWSVWPAWVRPQPPQAPWWPQWHWWTAALAHHSPAHWAANAVAALVVGAWGQAARVGLRHALAWCCAWPLTQALLITEPTGMKHYAGLSAVLHAGVVIACWSAWRQGSARERVVSGLVSAAVCLKLLWESPFVQALWQCTPVRQVQPVWLDEAGAVFLAGHAHACGALAGLLMAVAFDGIMASRRAPWAAAKKA